MTKQRLDKLMVTKNLVATRSEAENWIRLGRVKVEGRLITKAGFFTSESADIQLTAPERYVSRAGLKLASVAEKFSIDFKDAIVLDVGSSTGGFTDYALQHGARTVYAVDVGTDQLHPTLQGDRRIKLFEKTDIRDFQMHDIPDVIVIDVSFISLREVLPAVFRLASDTSQIVAMAKPQFEASRQQLNSSGVIKNDSIRRAILGDFERWSRQYFVITAKADSGVKGAKGNQERFYLLKKIV